MGNIVKKTSKQKISNTSKKVVHTFRVLTQKEINESRSKAYTFIL